MSRYQRPDKVPKLDLGNLPEYVSSSEEEADEVEDDKPLEKD